MPVAKDRHAWTCAMLTLRPSDVVLEIGCGNGQTAALVCAAIPKGRFTALDRSATALAKARARNHVHVSSGHAEFIEGDLLTANLPHGEFDVVFAFDVNVFWTQGPQSIAPLRQLLKKSGRAVLFFRPPDAEKCTEIEKKIRASVKGHGLEVVDAMGQIVETKSTLCVALQVQE